MCGLDGSDGRLPRFDAVEEVSVVRLLFEHGSGAIETNFCEIFWNFVLPVFPIRIRPLEATAVAPNPPVGADPFRPHLDVLVATGNRHHDVIRIFEGTTIFGAGVPDSVFGREFTPAFDFTR